MKVISKISVLILLICCFSCGPSVGDGKKSLLEKFDGLASIVKFSEINAIKRDYIYKMEFTAHVKILEDVLAYKDLSGMQKATKEQIQKCMGYDGQFRKKSFLKGSVYQIEGTITFEKTKNGWRKSGSSLKPKSVLISFFNKDRSRNEAGSTICAYQAILCKQYLDSNYNITFRLT